MIVDTFDRVTAKLLSVERHRIWEEWRTHSISEVPLSTCRAVVWIPSSCRGRTLWQTRRTVVAGHVLLFQSVCCSDQDETVATVKK